MHRRQVPRAAFQHGGFVAQKIGHIAHACLIAVLSDPETLVRFVHHRLGHFDPLFGRAQIGPRTAHFQPHCRVHPLFAGSRPLHPMA